MPLAKCPRSGKMFDNTHGPVHPDFMHEEEADYEKIFRFVEDNHGCTPEEVCEGTGVDRPCLDRLIRQDRLAAFSPEQMRKYEEEQRERKEEAAKRSADIARQLAQVKLPEKKAVSIGGSIHEILDDKRRVK